MTRMSHDLLHPPKARSGDRIATCLALLILIGKEQFTPHLAHVPLNVVGQHAQEDVGTDSGLEPMMDGADMQINRLH